MGDRSRSRELALKVLYQMEHGAESAEQALTSFNENFQAPPKLLEYARILVLGIEEHQEDIDDWLENSSRRWRLSRMPRVDRNILRLACYEMLYSGGRVPVKVAINEAVELAKRYGAEESPGFVNGVLDSLLEEAIRQGVLSPDEV